MSETTQEPQRDDGLPLDRAEQLVDDWSRRVAGWVARNLARAREEAEDIWAEAQTVRRAEHQD
jgi:hypothetical protein